jgi:amidase
MSDFNNDEYLKGQVKKQVEEEVISPCKLVINVPEVENKYKLIDETVESLQEKVKYGILTYEDIMVYYIDRINHHLHLNALIELNQNALTEAKNKYYDPDHDILYGIPILVKCNIGTDGMKTSAGAAVLKDLKISDSEIIKQLKNKGAIILGKTNLSEWANFMSTSSSNGYSALGGQTHNPYGTFDVGGSSSGSAVAIACQLAPLAIGTETAGSIIYPASQNSVVGLKPTLGLVSQDKIIPISKNHDTAGPMTRTVKDCYYLLRGIAEVRNAVFKDNLKDISIGIITNEAVVTYYRKGDEIILNQCITDLESLGAKVSTVDLDENAFETKVYDILKYEFREGVKKYLSLSDYQVKTLGDILAFNKKNMSNYAPYNHEIIKQAYEEFYDEEVINTQILENRKLTQNALEKALRKYDILLSLSNYSTSVYAPAGYPALCIPAGYRVTGEPLGITMIAKANEDVKLLEFAYAYEKKVNRYNPKESENEKS